MPFRLGIKCLRSKNDNLLKNVERAGFEPATLWSQTRCASQAALPLDFQNIPPYFFVFVNYSFL